MSQYQQSTDPELTKLNIAGHHVKAAMQMIGAGVNPFTIQMAVMAADEIIETLARHRNVQLPYDSRIFIKDEFQKDYAKLKRRAYNFFKHADRDPDAIYDGPAATGLQYLNELQTVFNIVGLRALGYDVPSVMTEFVILLGTYKPSLVKWAEIEAEHRELIDIRRDLPEMTYSMFIEVLRQRLRSSGLMTA